MSLFHDNVYCIVYIDTDDDKHTLGSIMGQPTSSLQTPIIWKHKIYYINMSRLN